MVLGHEAVILEEGDQEPEGLLRVGHVPQEERQEGRETCRKEGEGGTVDP